MYVYRSTYRHDFQWPDQRMDEDCCRRRLKERRHFSESTGEPRQPQPQKDKKTDLKPQRANKLLTKADAEAALKKDTIEFFNRFEWTPVGIMGRLLQPTLIPASMTKEQREMVEKMLESDEFHMLRCPARALPVSPGRTILDKAMRDQVGKIMIDLSPEPDVEKKTEEEPQIAAEETPLAEEGETESKVCPEDDQNDELFGKAYSPWKCVECECK